MVATVKVPVYVVVAGEAPTPDDTGKEAKSDPSCQRYATCSSRTTSIHFSDLSGSSLWKVGGKGVGVRRFAAVEQAATSSGNRDQRRKWRKEEIARMCVNAA
jgi:hypothetical protein